ncbi:MAG: hypothetical protein CAK90_04285 [Spartobacteria bacterium AMD-G4]|jgi:uncharacterized protein (TIGR02598 family)|nr:MAG: hypothetical protein CAK90_04285 [Spartobacteria bacterium AMD-G4]
MMAHHNTPNAGFSLIEVVIALGIFAFCIVAIVGLLPVGMNSVRSVSNENNAIHIASSIEGIWQVAPLGSTITMPNIITNLPVSTSQNSTYYFNEFGEPLTNSTGASLKMSYTTVNYTAAGTGNATTVNMAFSWPPGAGNPNNQTKREFSYTISK